MKTLIQRSLVLIIACLLSIQMVSAQKADTSSLSPVSRQLYDMYWKKHKAFNTAGWALMVPGAVMLTVGIAEGTSNAANLFSSNYSPNKGIAFFFVGGAMVLGSIPCFILAGSNARKAYLELKTSSVPGPGGFNYASVGIKIKL